MSSHAAALEELRRAFDVWTASHSQLWFDAESMLWAAIGAVLARDANDAIEMELP